MKTTLDSVIGLITKRPALKLFLKIGAFCLAICAIYGFGKIAGEFLYYLME